MRPEIDKEKCVGCGTCVSVCPTEPVVFKLGDDNKSVVVYPEVCVECGSCVENCPQEAITMVD